MFGQNIKYSSVNLKEGQQRESSAKSEAKVEVSAAELSATGNEVYENLAKLNKSEIVELKAMRAPPMAVQQVAEATFLLFAMQPKYENFVKLVNSSPNFIDDLNRFDVESVADFTLSALNKYISDPNFNKEYIEKISRFAAALCSWIRYVHQYATQKALVGQNIHNISFLL